MPRDTLEIRVRIYCGEEIAMGPGKASLLEAIRRHGSISAAGRVMDMSYRRAWLLVDAMNRCWNEPLVATSPGSAYGGARVTSLGKEVLAHYRAVQGQLHGAAQGAAKALAAAMRVEPKDSQKT
ncbi:MAG TPA: LysR family transcriptional regulator [Devosia sp.]|nr:LysR family transcriptional regulator [Devosia sp.]